MALPLVAWLVLGGVALAAAGSTGRSGRARPGVTGPTRRPHASDAGVGTHLVNATEYPAPYRWQDARQLAAFCLDAIAAENPPPEWVKRPMWTQVQSALEQISAAPIEPWRKTYATIHEVILPCYAAGLLWNWYRPRSTLKTDRATAVIAWCAVFFTLPLTATAAPTVDPAVVHSSKLPRLAPYLDPSVPLMRGLNVWQMRRALYDVFHYLNEWSVRHFEGEELAETAAAFQSQVEGIARYYPLSDPPVFVIEGNLRTVDLIATRALAELEGHIAVDFDEAAAWAQMALQVVGAVVSAVVPFVGPNVGEAIRTAADTVKGFAEVWADGQLSATEIQAAAGIGVTHLLDEAALRLDLPPV